MKKKAGTILGIINKEKKKQNISKIWQKLGVGIEKKIYKREKGGSRIENLSKKGRNR